MGNGCDHGWTDERIELLKKHFRDGLSATQSAGILRGVSRNAVIGKRARLGLTRGDRANGFNVDPNLVAHRLQARAKAPKVKRQPHLNAGLNFRATQPAPRPAAPPAAPKSAPARTVPVPIAADPKRICDEGFGGCRWPIAGEGADTLHCCAPIAAQAPEDPRRFYCEAHNRAAWSQQSPKAKASDQRRLERPAA